MKILQTAFIVGANNGCRYRFRKDRASLRDSLRMEPAHARALQSTVVALAIACVFNASIYDALIGDFFCVALGLLLALGLKPNTSTGLTLAPRTAG